jgi:hypothetical protein
MLRRTMSDPSDTGHPGALRVLKLLLAVAVVATGAVFSIARFGDPRFMPDGVYRLAQGLKNPRIRPEVPVAWTRLCQAWAGWLGNLEREGPWLLEREQLWGLQDPLRAELSQFYVHARELHPAAIISAAANTDLGTLATNPPAEVVSALQEPRRMAVVAEAGQWILKLEIQLERWPRWAELRALQQSYADRGYQQIAGELSRLLPPAPGSAGYVFDPERSVRYLNDLARDRDGLLQLATRWREYRQLAAELEKSEDPEVRRVPAVLLGQLRDQPTLRDFAAALEAPIAEMRQALDRAK